MVDSISAIAGLGLSVSFSLASLARTIDTAPERVEKISNDIYSTCGILNQIENLATAKPDSGGEWSCIFSAQGLDDIRSATKNCETIFKEIDRELKKASKQIANKRAAGGNKVVLSKSERAKWPFIQPGVEQLRDDLQRSKGNLMLFLAVATLAHSEKLMLSNQPTPLDPSEQRQLRATVMSLQRAATSPASKSSTKRARRTSKPYTTGETGETSAKPEGSSPTSIPDAGGEAGEPGGAGPSGRTGSAPVQAQSRGDPRGGSASQNMPTRGSDNRNAGPLAEPANYLGGPTPLYSPHPLMPLQGNLGMTAVLPIKAELAPIAQEADTSSRRVEKSRAPALRQLLRNLRHKDTSESENQSSITKPDNPKSTGPSHAVVSAADPKPSAPVETTLQAWTMDAVPTDVEGGPGCVCRIEALPIPQEQIKARLERQQKRTSSVLECLEKLNPHQRSMVMGHATRKNSNLLAVDVLQRVNLATVFGELEIAVLMWITESSPVPLPRIAIFIEMSSGRVTPFSVNLSDTVVSVKLMVKETKGIPLEEQRLVFANRTLDDNKTLAFYEIEEEATITLIRHLREGGISVTIKTLDGNLTDIEVNTTATIWDLKYIIQSLTDIPRNKQSIYFGGGPLQNTRVISDYNIRSGDVLQLVHRPSSIGSATMEWLPRSPPRSPAISQFGLPVASAGPAGWGQAHSWGTTDDGFLEPHGHHGPGSGEGSLALETVDGDEAERREEKVVEGLLAKWTTAYDEVGVVGDGDGEDTLAVKDGGEDAGDEETRDEETGDEETGGGETGDREIMNSFFFHTRT